MCPLFSLSALLLVGFFSSGFSLVIKSAPCQGVQPEETLDSLEVYPCTADPCVIKKHSTYHVRFNMTMVKPVTSSQCKVQAYIAGTWVKYPGFDETDFCNRVVPAACPLKAGQKVSYITDVSIPNVPTFLLPDQVLVKWHCFDQAQQTTLCRVAQIRIDKSSLLEERFNEFRGILPVQTGLLHKHRLHSIRARHHLARRTHNSGRI